MPDYDQTESLSQTVRRLSKAIELDPGNAQLYAERGKAYFEHQNYFNAYDDFQMAISCWNGDDETLKRWQRNAADILQRIEDKPIEERLLPYSAMIRTLKENPQQPITEVVAEEEEYVNLIAAMAFFEEYELLERVLGEEARPDGCKNDKSNGRLNSFVSPALAWWEPTPLYFITGHRAHPKMKNPCKMLTFLAAHGADPNKAAGEGSTPLWNQCNTNGSSQILKTLLEIGADPNKISSDDNGSQWYPLPYCLLPVPDESDAGWRPYGLYSIEKAKYLLEHGADPNLDSPVLSGYKPLSLAIVYGKGAENLELIELLLEKGADINAVDNEEKTPLALTIENDLFEIGQLLLLYGADPAPLIEQQRQRRQMGLMFDTPLNHTGALFAPPALTREIEQCNNNLNELKLPLLPDGLIAFLKIWNGFAWNSVEIYGTESVTEKDSNFTLNDIVSASDDFKKYYGDILPGDYLCFGRQNGDYYTYNPENGKYEVRSHEWIADIWDEYDSFEVFLEKEVGKFLCIT